MENLRSIPTRFIVACAVAAVFVAPPRPGAAQEWSSCSSRAVTDEGFERWRLSQLNPICTDSATFPLLRSVSTQLDATNERTFNFISPSLHVVSNSALPFSMNDGALWAGKGVSTRITGGIRAQLARVRLVLMPEFLRSANGDWQIRDSTRFPPPVTPEDRRGGGYVFPWYVHPNSIDLPLRFGADSWTRLVPGQSSVIVPIGQIAIGLSTENHWWGPGIHNALVLSNNASGFPHLVLRTDRPLRTRLGLLEARWLVGGISESQYFDTVSANDSRSLSAIALTLTPARAPNLTFGLARSVMEPTAGWGEIPFRWLSVLKSGRTARDDATGDSTTGPSREQITSMFVRWVAPQAGLEVYGELGRTELPTSLRDMLIAPNHSQGYTLGFQWARPLGNESARFRIQGELTTIEQSATFRDRPLGVWYTSKRIPQGYTHDGQSLGAAIGPGASNQWLAFDYFTPRSSVGLYGGRIRWHEDIRSLYPWPDYQSWCNHDVSLVWGVRGSRRSRLGDIRIDATFGNRINAFFQVQSGCPRGDSMLDIRNNTLRLTFTPFRGR